MEVDIRKNGDQEEKGNGNKNCDLIKRDTEEADTLTTNIISQVCYGFQYCNWQVCKVDCITSDTNKLLDWLYN